jgi:hypothetical protein
MNTTAAASTAGVTVATVRTWCRKGVVAAAKAGGRWVIDAASLAYRISLGKKASMDKYEITETVKSWGTTYYTVTRTDGTPTEGIGSDSRIWHASYVQRADAELVCEYLNSTPAEYRITKEQYSGRRIGEGHGCYWKITGRRAGDPRELKATIDSDRKVSEINIAAGRPRIVDSLIYSALQHAEDADERIAKKAEADAVEAAEQAVRQARADQLAEIERTRGPLATPRQIDFILQLLAKREITGEGGGFYYGPKDRAGLEAMTKAEASVYIDSLKGDY